jgi:hypothetical protein
MMVALQTSNVADDQNIEVLFPEARKIQRRRRLTWIVVSLLALTLTISLGTVLTTTSATRPPVKPRPLATRGQVSQFVRAAQRATNSEFTATYRVKGNSRLFFVDGVFTISRIPGPTGAKPIVNGDGTWQRGHYAYIVHATNGSIVQWIENGAQVTTCMKIPLHGTGRLLAMKCFGPFPDIAANGFIYETVAFVPTMAIQQVSEMVYPKETSYFTSQFSAGFGELRCLHQLYETESLTTCEDSRGFVASSVSRDRLEPIGPKNVWTSAFLTSFSHRANPTILTPLKKPTSRLTMLPPL